MSQRPDSAKGSINQQLNVDSIGIECRYKPHSRSHDPLSRMFAGFSQILI